MFHTDPYGLYRVETAALRAKAPDYFDETIKNAVLKHFDQQIHEKVQVKEAESRGKIEDFFASQEGLLADLREEIRTDRRLD